MKDEVANQESQIGLIFFTHDQRVTLLANMRFIRVFGWKN